MALPDPKRKGIPARPVRPVARKPVAGGGQRRRYAPAAAGSDGLDRLMIRVGIFGAVLVFGVIARMATAKPAGDQKYFDSLVNLTHSLDKGIVMSRESIRRQVSEMPIGGVSDPKLKEIHQVLLQLLSLSPNDESKLDELGNRFDRLVDELNRKYVR
jgi:hypothetical protein